MSDEKMSDNTTSGTHTAPDVPSKSEENKKNDGKWYSLSSIFRFLGISSILTIITFVLTNYFTIQNDRQKDMTDYLEVMSDLMLKEPLYLPKDKENRDKEGKATTTDQHDHTKWLARALTLNVLRRLGGISFSILDYPIDILNDVDRKGQLIKFLYESRLIGYCTSSLEEDNLQEKIKCDSAIVSLQDAGLEGTKVLESIAVLSGVSLSDAVLRGADLSGLDLKKANFSNARLRNANMAGSILDEANFRKANLLGANLSGASVIKTDFSESILCGANLDGLQRVEEAIFKRQVNGKEMAAFYDDRTVFPNEDEGFPKNHGMTKLQKCN